MLLYTFPCPPLQTNTYLIAKENHGPAAVVDPGTDSTEKILHQAKKDDLKIEKILLTHSHWDHFIDVQALKEKTGAPIYVHTLDAKNVESPGSDGLPLFVSITPAKVDHQLQDGEIIEVGPLFLEVIHTPGHSPGGVCFYLKNEAVLFSGDTFFHGTIGRLDLPTGSAPKMWTSLKKLSKLPSHTRVFPGHGPETTIGKESWLSQAEEFFHEM